MSGSSGVEGNGNTTDSMTILVLGDERVGKSSLISTFVSRHFSEVVPGLMTRVRLPPEPETNFCVTTIVDSQGGDSALLSAVSSETSLSTLQHQHQQHQSQSQSKLQSQSSREGRIVSTTSASFARSTLEQRVDAIVLVYDLDRLETFYRLENHWLPLIEKCYNGEVPVIVAGNKIDLIRPTSHTTDTEEQSLIRSRQLLVSLLQRFRFVRQCIKCSAKNVLRVADIFIKAQQAVLFPFAPLYDLSCGKLTQQCQKAFTRIFRMFDQDHDGLLSNEELDQFQYQTFRVPLVERDLAGWKKAVARNNTIDEEVVRDGKFTVAGFLAIFDVFITQNRLDVPWKVLRKFGYQNDLTLKIAPEKRPSLRLSTGSRQFLTNLFLQFDSDRDGILDDTDLKQIFSILTEPSLPPWHPMRASILLDSESTFSFPASFSSSLPSCPDSPRESSGGGGTDENLSVSASGITILSEGSIPTVGGDIMPPAHSVVTLPNMTFLEWMGHWHMLSAISPGVTREELFRLGYVSEKRKRKGGLGRNANTLKSTPQSQLPSEEIKVVVLSKAACGKTAFLHLLCGKNVHDTYPTRRPETCTTHRVMKQPKNSLDKKPEEADIVVHYILTEVPEGINHDKLKEVIASPHGNNKTRKLVVFLFDDQTSLQYAIDLEQELLHDEIPRVFLSNRGNDIQEATKHCQQLDLEPPLIVNVLEADQTKNRDTILTHLAKCVVDENVKAKPHALKKKREAARRRKMMWLGGLFSMSVAVAVGVGVLWSGKHNNTEGGESKSRFRWLTQMLFGSKVESTAGERAITS